MEEASSTIPTIEDPLVAEPAPPTETPTIPEEPTDGAKKKRGRPEGSKDRAPRKKKVVIEEAPPDHTSDAPEQPAVHQQQEQEPPEPPSPTEVLRDASRVVRQAQVVRMQTRRTNLQEIYTRHLLSLP